MKRILFVCTGNICRSPTADGVARQMAADLGRAQDFEFDSAGIERYHEGEPPDSRAQRRAAERGYDLSALRARAITPQDFTDFDLILAMDRDHLRRLERDCPKAHQHKLKLFLSYAAEFALGDVPDPYYGEISDFDLVLDMCEDVVPRLIAANQPN